MAAVVASAAGTYDFVLTDVAQGVEIENWQISNEALGIAAPFTVSKTTLHGGRQEGSTLVTIDTGDLQLVIVPTRGMGLFNAVSGDVTLGWKSPVEEVVHPSFINLAERGGLGWLDGFNEMLARCGFEWAGHPCTENGRTYTLHGRAQNIPASTVIVSIEAKAPHRITVKGLVKEKTFKFSNLETWAGVSAVPGERAFRVHDELRNLADYERPYQVIYHANFGAPLLEGGAHFRAAAKEVIPFNDYAKKGLADWQTYLPVTPGFDEMVFNIWPLADASGNTLAMMSNQADTRGVAIGYNVKQLPALSLWKNTDTEADGYVTGIEPGTSYAYNTKYQRPLGLVPKLQPGQSQRFDLSYTLLRSKADTEQALADVAKIQGKEPVKLVNKPLVDLNKK